MMEDVRAGVCPACRYNEIVEAPLKLRVGGSWVEQFLVPLHEHGPLMLYACRRCGHVEPRVANVADVPIGPQYDTRLIKGSDPQGPYR
jgi:hypothetical protein